MQGVELVSFLIDILQPVPLDDGRFEERGGSVRVVFEELGRPGAVVHEIEAAVEGWRLFVPSPFDERNGLRENLKLCVALVVDDVLRGGEAHGLEFVGGGFELVNLLGCELVTGRLVPIGAGTFGQ